MLLRKYQSPSTIEYREGGNVRAKAVIFCPEKALRREAELWRNESGLSREP